MKNCDKPEFCLIEEGKKRIFCGACPHRKTRGGKREGAGRPKGSGKGRTVKTSSINLHPDLWAKMDALRGTVSRSAWIAEKIKRARK